MSEMNAIETVKLTKMYGKSRGIKDLDLTIREGDFFGFIGPNGAGKSTTIRTLLGLIRPTGGSARIFGMDTEKDKTKILAETGYLPSETDYYRGMRVRDVLLYSAKLRKKDTWKDAEEMADRLQLDLTKKVDELSLGNRKKVGIITAIQHHPKLIILDEPTSGLDPLMQREFFRILQEENSRGATIFFSSHILSEVQEHCRTAAFIRDGRIILSDRVEKLGHSGTKKVEVRSNAEQAGPGLAGIRSLPGVSVTEEAEGVLRFMYAGDIRILLRQLADGQITDVSITEPSMEEIFMHYYQSEEKGERS